MIQLRDQFSGTLRNVNANLSVFQRQASYAGRNMMSVGKDLQSVGKTFTKTLTVPIVAAGGALLKLGQDFQDAENTIRVGTGATGKDLQNLTSDFKATYSQVSNSMADTSKVIADLNTRTGLSGKPLQALSVQMLNLSKITKEDLNTLIPATTRMFQDAGLKQADYSKALDYTFKVSQNTGISVSKLQELMTQFGGPLRQMGFSWQTSAVMLGKFEKEGVNTELVVGSLRIALGKMAKKGIADPSKALQEMITKIKDAGTAGKANAMALSMFGAKAGPDMAAAIREGHLDLDNLLRTIKNSPETIDQATADTMTFADKMAKVKNQLAVAFEPVATSLLDSLDKLLPSIKNVGDTIAKFAKRIADMSPQQQEMILKFALMAAAAGPVIFTVGKLVYGMGDAVKTFTKLSRSISNAGGILEYLQTPGGMVIAIIGTLTIAGLLLVTHWAQVTKSLNDFKTVLKNNETAIRNVAIALGVIFGPALVGLGVQALITGGQITAGFIASLVTSGIEAAATGAVFTGKLIVSLISFALQVWKTVAVIGIQTTLFIAQRLGIISAAEATNIITAAQWLFNAAMNANPIGVVILALAALGVAIYEVVQHWKDICTWVEKAWNWLTKWNGTQPQDKSLNVTTNVATSAATTAHNALGTSYFGGGSTWVGENGPEILTLPKGSQVMDHQTSKRSTGKNISIAKLADTIVVREEADIDKIATALVLKLHSVAINTA